MSTGMTPDTQASSSVDVLIVGAGLAGTSTAIILARAGYSVALLDTQAVYPAEFRAEKLGDVHMALLVKLGLDAAVTPATTVMDDIWVYRYGRFVAKEKRREYGFAYSGLINALRGALPPEVDFIIGRVADIRTGPDRQSVVLADGRAIDARLVVLSTGLGDAVRRAAGIRREETRKAHSLSLAFCLDQPRSAYPFQALTYFGSKREDQLAYLTLFPIGDKMRGNLFVYRQPAEAWTKEFRRAPQAELVRLAPEIVELCAGFGVDGAVELRPIDLVVTHDYRRDGIVLLGDAFCTTCPAPGVGIQRVLNDVDVLCNVHLPRWFATPGMQQAKIETFYDDPVKQAMDVKGIGLSNYARAIVIEHGSAWRFRRLRNAVVRKGLYGVRDFLGRWRGRQTNLASPPLVPSADQLFEGHEASDSEKPAKVMDGALLL